MPHFGILDANAQDPEATELLRARLHIRSGRLRLREGRIHEGISTLFDALLSSLRWYVLSPGRAGGLDVREEDDLNYEAAICEALKRSGVIGRSFDLERLTGTVERTLEQGADGLDHVALASEMESVMETLGVIPFDESVLPPEHHSLRYPPQA